MKASTSMRKFLPFICLLMSVFILVSCSDWPSQETDRTTTAEESETAESSETSEETTQTQTSRTETTATTTPEPTTTEPIETIMPTPPPETIDFRVISANETVLIDLNGDGDYESIHYTILDSFSFNLELNGETRRYEGEFFLPDYFFLINLDNSNQEIDIAVQEMGTSDDYQVKFYYFDGIQLIRRGSVPGLISDITSETITTDPFGSGNISANGNGQLQGMARGQILHTWFYPEMWIIGPDNLLRREHQDIVTMYSYSESSGTLTSSNPVELRRDLILYEQAGSADIAGTASIGESADLIRTDNQAWVQLQTESGLIGWFQVIDYFFIPLNGEQIFADEVFSGLSFAD